MSEVAVFGRLAHRGMGAGVGRRVGREVGVGHTGVMVRRARSEARSIAGTAFVVAWVVATLAGCTSAYDDAGGAAAVSEPSITAVGTVSTATETTTATTTAIETTVASTTTSPVDETIATVPEQAVPGIDSEDPFCRAWSEFAGSFQALTFASIEAADPLVGARLEVVAAGAVVAAARSLDDAFPDEIAEEREVFVGDVIGPFARRAARAVDELRSAGVDDEDVELLGAAWLAALAASDPADPVIAVDVPAELEPAVDAATAAFAADVPPIAGDPSLVTRAEASGTLGYLAEQCPDQGVLAGNDAID